MQKERFAKKSSYRNVTNAREREKRSPGTGTFALLLLLCVLLPLLGEEEEEEEASAILCCPVEYG